MTPIEPSQLKEVTSLKKVKIEGGFLRSLRAVVKGAFPLLGSGVELVPL
jgi:hypothetical protein